MAKGRKIRGEDPLQVAHELVRKNFNVDYIHSVIQGITVDPVHDRLLKAVHPRSGEIERTQTKLHRQAKGTEAETLVRDLDTNWCDRAVVWSDAAFTAGIALGIRLAGKQGKQGKAVRK